MEMSPSVARSLPKSSPRVRSTLLLVALMLATLPTAAFAHAVVHPTRSEPGAYERYVLRVPNERDVPTTRVEIAFPEEVRVVSFAEVPGWELQLLTDSASRVTGAVWTGELPPGRFVDLPFVAVNPGESARLAWPTDQTYADGVVVAWSGPEGSSTPASFTRIAADHEGAPPTALLLSVAAVAISLLTLGLALRWRHPAG